MISKMKVHINNIDGLRAISCIGIIAMHILANSNYSAAEGWMKNTFIPSLTLLVYLFMMISGFGMSMGYYERFKNHTVDFNAFYKRRYIKILPFFSLLIFLDIVITRSGEHLIQGLVELTMVFGLLPNNQLDVVGVAWFLGVVFLFYMLFPFFVFLCWTKKRAWVSFIVSILLNIACANYFYTSKFVIPGFSNRHTLLYCSPFLILGELIYLYRLDISGFFSKLKIGVVIPITITVFFYISLLFNVKQNFSNDVVDLETIIVFGSWLGYAIGTKQNNYFLSNKVMKYLSSISMEMYLAQMFVFDALKKIGVLYLLGRGYLSYTLTLCMTILGLIILVEVYKLIIKLFKQGYSKLRFSV